MYTTLIEVLSMILIEVLTTAIIWVVVCNYPIKRVRDIGCHMNENCSVVGHACATIIGTGLGFKLSVTQFVHQI